MYGMNKLENFVEGNWVTGDGDGQELYDAVTAEPVASATTQGLDFKAMIDYAHKVGNPNLRKITFHESGSMLRALALHLRNHLEKFYASLIKPALQKQIAGLILKAVSVIFFQCIAAQKIS